MRALFCALFLLLLAALPAAALDLPQPQGYVTDQADILSAATVVKLERFLQGFEQSDSTQLVVLTLPSLEGLPIEEVALKAAESWKIGQKGKDNGALLLIAKEERKIRIEVGRGLEGRLTDLLAGRIVDNEMRPRFKQGDFDGGVIAGVAAMAEAVRGEYQGTGKTARQGRKSQGVWWLFPLLFFGLPLLLRFGSHSSAYGHRRSGGFWIGGPPFGGGGFGGGSGGGFSGGRGGFSGGGASGDW